MTVSLPSSDRAPVLLQGMEERLLTRFKWGMVAELEKPTVELRKNILRNKIHRDGLQFPPEVTIDDVFLRNSDDCIALYTHRWNFYGDCRNVRVLNSTLWADIAHPINIGTHGNTETGDEVLEDMLFKNIDILEHDEDDRDYQGCMAINVGDHNLAQNITFEDIRVEHIQEGQLFHLRVMYNRKYNTGPGRGVRNIVFRNISCTGKFVNPSLFEGYDKDRKVEDILFENIVLNGKRVTSPDELNINKREFVDKMHIK